MAMRRPGSTVGPVRPCSRRALLAILAASVTGCLPTGNAPIGRHLVSDRTLTGVHFSPSEIDGIPSHVLVTGPTQEKIDYYTPTVADLYAIPEGTRSGAALGEAKLLAARSPVPQGAPADYAVQTDIRGRLLVERSVGPTWDYEIFRIDLVTGAEDLLGTAGWDPPNPMLTLSPGRTRVLLGWSSATVWDLGGENASVNTRGEASFVGEDLYYNEYSGPNNQTPNLWRVKPRGQPELLASNAFVSLAFATDLGPRLILGRYLSTVDPRGAPGYLVFDPATLQEIPLPPDLYMYQGLPWNSKFLLNSPPASPDGHWLLSQYSGDVTFFNWLTSEIQHPDLATSGGGNEWEWRPRHEELWFGTFLSALTTLSIWKPDTDVTTVRLAPFQNYQAPTARSLSIFTSDGGHFFSTFRPGDKAYPLPPLYLGSADDPTGPLCQITPDGIQVDSHWELADGRVLAGAWTWDDDESRKNYYLVDPHTGASQAFAINGQVVALGHTRALALVDWQIDRKTGDLCLIDLATGAQTLLAKNVYTVAVDPGTHADVPPDIDALAAGTRIAFLVRNPFASPYDGLWVAELP